MWTQYEWRFVRLCFILCYMHNNITKKKYAGNQTKINKNWWWWTFETNYFIVCFTGSYLFHFNLFCCCFCCNSRCRCIWFCVRFTYHEQHQLIDERESETNCVHNKDKRNCDCREGKKKQKIQRNELTDEKRSRRLCVSRRVNGMNELMLSRINKIVILTSFSLNGVC